MAVMRLSMSKTRLEAFSDGVIAILITIMVLELHSPAGADLGALAGLLPQLALYLLSFVMLGIYWNNHHHLLHATTHVNGAVLWANLHLLFWLSLIPFATRWIGESGLAPLPTALRLRAVAVRNCVHDPGPRHTGQSAATLGTRRGN